MRCCPHPRLFVSTPTVTPVVEHPQGLIESVSIGFDTTVIPAAGFSSLTSMAGDLEEGSSAGVVTFLSGKDTAFPSVGGSGVAVGLVGPSFFGSGSIFGVVPTFRGLLGFFWAAAGFKGFDTGVFVLTLLAGSSGVEGNGGRGPSITVGNPRQQLKSGCSLNHLLSSTRKQQRHCLNSWQR